MSRILVKFYRNNNGALDIVRTELCDSYMEADALVENESDHYDTVTMIDIDSPPENE